MSMNELSSRVENDRVLVLERTFDAPRDLVFSMFKEPEHLKYWWGPIGWNFPFAISISDRVVYGITA